MCVCVCVCLQRKHVGMVQFDIAKVRLGLGVISAPERLVGCSKHLSCSVLAYCHFFDTCMLATHNVDVTRGVGATGSFGQLGPQAIARDVLSRYRCGSTA